EPDGLLPVRFTPGMVRISSDRSLAGGRFSISLAVMVDTPGACLTASSAEGSTRISSSEVTPPRTLEVCALALKLAAKAVASKPNAKIGRRAGGADKFITLS